MALAVALNATTINDETAKGLLERINRLEALNQQLVEKVTTLEQHDHELEEKNHELQISIEELKTASRLFFHHVEKEMRIEYSYARYLN